MINSFKITKPTFVLPQPFTSNIRVPRSEGEKNIRFSVQKGSPSILGTTESAPDCVGKDHSWRLIDSGVADAAMNMAIDEAIALACLQGQSPATLRFYTWQPAALSIGYFQNVEEEIDLTHCRAQGYGFVRRPTGGKAVFHDQELTYSVAAKADNPLFPRDLHGAFLVIAEALISGLNHLGIQAQVFEYASRKRQSRSSPSSPSCFASAMGFEIGVEGKKLIGSAQRRWREGFLQQGSILCHFCPEKLFDLLKFSDESKRKQALSIVTRTVTSLSSIHRQEIDLKPVKEGLIKGFEETLTISLTRSELTPFELDLAQQLAHQKYRTDVWNLQHRQTL